MGSWGLRHHGNGVESFGIASNQGTLVTAAGSAHTKGTPVELTAATATEAHGIYVMIVNTSGGAEFLLDILIGASTEAVFIANIRHTSRNITQHTTHAFFPLRVPAGSRLAAAVQSNTASAAVRVCGLLFAPNPRFPAPFSTCTTYGAVTASTLGTTIPGHTTTPNTLGTVTQIVASTSDPVNAMCIGIGGAGDSATSANMSCHLQILTGAATESLIIPLIMVGRDTSCDSPNYNMVGPFPCNIPAGGRIAGQVSSTTATAGDRDLDVIIYGLS